jgi:hypothetical protein
VLQGFHLRVSENKTSSLLFPYAPLHLFGKLILKTKEVSRQTAKDATGRKELSKQI